MKLIHGYDLRLVHVQLLRLCGRLLMFFFFFLHISPHIVFPMASNLLYFSTQCPGEEENKISVKTKSCPEQLNIYFTSMNRELIKMDALEGWTPSHTRLELVPSL